MSSAGLKIAINTRNIESPYGGGNQFVNYMDRYLTSKGCRVTRELIAGLDAILLVNVGPFLSTMSFTPAAIADYLKLYPRTTVIQRINTADEPRGKDLGINRAVLEANRIADYSVFVSHYAQKLFERHGFDVGKPHCVIHTGSDENIFNPAGRAESGQVEPLRIVTHHWSDNYLKGFDIYERLDRLLGKSRYKGVLEFTLIGNKTLGVEFENTRVLPPMNGPELAAELKRHHFYLTGARCEPGGNHYIEAISCGLPVLYLESGSSGEYCAEYGGVGYDLTDFEEKLQMMIDQLDERREKVLDYGYSARSMADTYWELIQRQVDNPESQIRKRGSILVRAGVHLKKFWNKLLGKTCYVLNRLKVNGGF